MAPGENRVVVLLSNPLAMVRGHAPGVEGALTELPVLDTEAEARHIAAALRDGSRDSGVGVEVQTRIATVDALRSAVTLGATCLHFAGHGHPEFLCFEDGRGGASVRAVTKLPSRRGFFARGAGRARSYLSAKNSRGFS